MLKCMKRYIFIMMLLITMLSLTGCGNKKEQEKLNKLIANLDNDEAKRLVDKGYSLNNTFTSDIILSLISQNEYNGNTPLCTACRCENTEMIRYLLENGANPNITRFRQCYPLELFLSHSYDSDESLLELFIEKGVNVNKYEIRPPMVELMKHYDCPDDEAEAEKIEKREIVEREIKILIENGVKWQNDDMNTQYAGYSILHFVAATDRTDFMKELLTYENARNYINSQTSKGYTPLHFAAFNNERDMYNLLIQEGADTSIKDDNNMLAEEYMNQTY